MRNLIQHPVFCVLIFVVFLATATPQVATAAYPNCDPACNHLGPQARCSCVPPYFHTTCGQFLSGGCGPFLTPPIGDTQTPFLQTAPFQVELEACQSPGEAAATSQSLSRDFLAQPQVATGNSFFLAPLAWYPPPTTCINGLACSVPADCPGGVCVHHTTPWPGRPPRTCACL